MVIGEKKICRPAKQCKDNSLILCNDAIHANCDNNCGCGTHSLLEVTRSLNSNQKADKVESKTSHKCFQVTVKSNRLSWVKSNQEVLTYGLIDVLGYRLDFGEPFSPTPGISVTLQYAKYNTKYEISPEHRASLLMMISLFTIKLWNHRRYYMPMFEIDACLLQLLFIYVFNN